MKYIIRPAQASDIAEIIRLCEEHSIYEKAEYSSEGKLEKLSALLFSEQAPLNCLLAEVNHQIVGYATYSFECSTWDASLYAHMDCLFIREAYRGHGIGEALVERILKDSKATIIQWQTPSWNEKAIKFYNRIGAQSKEKLRFYLHKENFSSSIG